jgi:hypothetical protein
MALDTYSLNARLRPALIVCLPVILGIIVWFPMPIATWGTVVGLATGCGMTAFLAQLGRDRGKSKEQRLFERWGGKPTTQLLRHRDRQLDSNTKARYHMKLGTLVSGIRIPTAEQEAHDTKAADEVYESCVLYLRENTRDRDKFRMVYQENVNYGFRRNLWGMKPAGVFLSLVGLVACVLALIVNYATPMVWVAITGALLNGSLLVWMTLRVSPKWVRLAGVAYAERLLATCDSLKSDELTQGQTLRGCSTTAM